ncbi:MAG: DHA2 family efflux MFS transporter permease subunit [Armatimonadetes bacterium]|nr:DHA2 family efflux MFS transporter permease subunit [Armatimonadota bacterium]
MASSATFSTAIPSLDINHKYRWLILIGLMTAAVMEILDTTIVNVALPTMAGNLSATTTEVAWVSTGYILSNVIVLPMTAYLTGVFGRRNYLSASILIFIISSFLCGVSHSLVELVLWRICQGIGGAALLSTAQATIRQIFPKQQQPMVQTIFLLGIIVAPTLGPTLGGWITENYTWNWCFFINVPIGIASFFLVSNFLQDPPGMRNGSRQPDWLGIGLLAVGLGSLQYVLEEGNQHDWFQDDMIVRLAVLSAICLIVLLWWQFSPRNKQPVIEFRVLKNRDLTAAILLFVSMGFGLYGGVFIFPLFSQGILGFNPTETGLALLPGGIATATSSMIVGQLLSRTKIDPRYIIMLGVGLFIFSMWDLAHLSVMSGFEDVKYPLLIRGFALGFLFAPINSVAYANIDPREAQQASGLINLARQLGGSFGIAYLGTFVTTRTAFHRASLVDHLQPDNPAVQNRIDMVTHGVMARGVDAERAHQAGVAILNGTVNKQSAMLAFNDSWMLILAAFVVATPAIFLLRKPKASGGAPAGGGH